MFKGTTTTQPQTKKKISQCFSFHAKKVTDIEGDYIQRDLQKFTMGVYVINKKGGEIGAQDDIGIYVEGEVILDNIGSVAQACAMMLGVIYVLNMAYPKELKYSYEFIKKVLLKGFPPKSLD
ncbi:hypothetical protein cypCar_00024400 [Cyprinus carpio]|nr:hypothetical protein cypCar_00024400 [Cyprinus carpio]